MFKARLNSCFFTFLFGLALAVTTQLANAAPFQKGYALVGDHLLEVELAATSTQREIGLSNRGLEKKYYFMVFIFDAPQKVSFWMKASVLKRLKNRCKNVSFLLTDPLHLLKKWFKLLFISCLCGLSQFKRKGL